MGILNVTPDSFSDAGQYQSLDHAVEQALAMQVAGAGIIDVGGESTRPGAAVVPVGEELQRVLPIIERLDQVLEVPISIDTTKPEVMRAAVAAGAGLINDVNALQADQALETAAALQVPVCLMHRQGVSATMQDAPHYVDVVQEVTDFLCQRGREVCQAGIEQVVLDVGFGFGKTFAHNQALFQGLSVWHAQCRELGYASLVGVSRKRMIGEALDRESQADDPKDRVIGSAVLAAMAIQAGAHIVRVHDVQATRDAIKIMQVFAEGN